MLLRQLELVHAWRRFPALDPALPRELLPPRWTGTRAAELFPDRHERWLGDARREWKRLEQPEPSRLISAARRRGPAPPARKYSTQH